jgi:AsmA family protein
VSGRRGWILGTLGALAILLIGVLIVFDWNWLKGPIERQASGSLGRPFRINGHLEVEPTLQPKITIESAELGNAPWGSDEPMAKVDRVEVTVDLLKLLEGEIVLPEIRIAQPTLLLETRPDGPPNWQFGETEETAPAPLGMPRIGRLEVSDASIHYHDFGSGQNITAALPRIAGRTDPGLKLNATGKLQGEPLDLEITGAALAQLENSAEPYSASLAIKLGQSDLRGNVTLDLSGPRPFIGVDVESDELRARDLDVAAAEQPPPASADTGGEAASQKPTSASEGRAALLTAAGVNFDALPKVDTDVTFRGRNLEAPGARLARLELDLKLRDGVAVIDAIGEATFREWQPLTFEIHVGTEDSLENPQSRYPLDITFTAGDSRAAAKGTVDHPLNYTGLDVEVSLQGPDLEKLGEILKLPLPGTPPYKLAGKITHQEQEKRWNLVALKGTVGDSDIQGDVSLELSGERPTVVADLQSNTLDLDDLGVLVGAPPGTGPGETASAEQKQKAAQEAAAKAPVLPDKQFAVPELRTVDARISFTGEKVQALKLPLEHMQAKVTLEDGHVKIDPARVDLAGGKLETRVGLDGRSGVLNGDLDLTLREIKLNQLLAVFKVDVGAIEMEKEGVGVFGGEAKLTTKGNSIHDMAAGANGELAVIMSGGQINALIVEAIGLDLGEVLAVLMAGAEEKQSKMVPVQCFVSRFNVQDGVMATKALALETSDSTVTGSGKIDLGKERLDLRLLAQPKDASVLTASTPVALEGTFRDPKIDVVSEELEEKGLAALALGVVLPVIGAILPFIETGEAPGVNCAALMKAASAADGVAPGTPSAAH